MRLGVGHTIILTAVLVSVIGTFFAANAVTGFSVAREGIGKGDFADITGKATAETGQASSFQKAAGSILFGLLSIATLVVVARMGRNAFSEARQLAPDITSRISKAEEAAESGNHAAAYSLYAELRKQYSTLAQQEKAKHHSRIMKLHRELSQQAAIMEAQHLTDKYVNGTITEEEFERLRMLIASQ